MVFYCVACNAEPPASDAPYYGALCGDHQIEGRRTLGVTGWQEARVPCPICGTRGYWEDRQYFECVYPQHIERIKLDANKAQRTLL